MEPTTIKGINNQKQSEEVFFGDNYVFVYLCVFCNEQFYCNNLFVKHLSNEHSVEPEGKKSNVNQQIYNSEGELKSDEDENLLDEINEALTLNSTKEFETKNTADNQNDNLIPIESCSSNHVKPSTKSKQIKKAKTIYKCSYCPKLYQSKSSLDNHRKAHEKTEKIKCRHESCLKTFTSSSGYFHHMRTHANEKAFKCQFCPKRFDQKCNLEVHIRRSHTLDKPYKCEFCEKSFASSSDRQIHQRLHTGEKPFNCDLCNKQFVTASKMIQHRKIHIEVKKYRCKKCDAKFSTRTLLYKHSLEHVEEKFFDCNVCGKRCRRWQTLRDHKKIHDQD